METPTEKIIAEMCKEIVRVEDPSHVVLMGSCAEGKAGPDSDVDILVVTREEFGSGHERRNITASIRRALSRFRVPKDILVYSPSELEKWKESKNHILYTGLKKGRVLYERPKSCAADAADGAQGSFSPGKHGEYRNVCR